MTRTCPITQAARAAPERFALRFGDRTWTYAELDAETARFGRALRSLGLGSGDRLAILGANRWEWMPLIFAAWRLGAAIVPLNARLTDAELHAQLARARPVVTVSERALGPAVRVVPFEFAEEAGVTATDAPECHEEVAAILFTSGTTGVPKAAALTWANLEAAAIASARNIGGGPGHRWLLCLPAFHVGGLSILVRAAVYGCGVVIHPRFDPEAVNSAFDGQGITHASLVATGLRRVLERRGDRPFPRALKAILIGGGPVPADLLARARMLGAPVLQTYGLTEASAQVTTERPSEADGTTAGPPLPGIALRIMDGEGAELPPGAIGEIEVRGATVMAGYLDDESETHQALWKGWLRTRDLGSLDERGRLRVASRRTDLIVTGGENVYPAEVEAVLLSLPGVEDAAVIGLEDPEWGQRVVAAIVGTATDEALLAGCRERLAGFKVPKELLRVSELPRNAGGKVDRAALRRLLVR